MPYIRIRAERRYIKIPLEDWNSIVDTNQTDQELKAEELSFQIRSVAKHKLTRSEHLIFIDSKLDGYKNKEIMKRHEIAEQTVKNKISSSLKKMRQALKEMLDL